MYRHLPLLLPEHLCDEPVAFYERPGHPDNGCMSTSDDSNTREVATEAAPDAIRT